MVPTTHIERNICRVRIGECPQSALLRPRRVYSAVGTADFSAAARCCAHAIDAAEKSDVAPQECHAQQSFLLWATALHREYSPACGHSRILCCGHCMLWPCTRECSAVHGHAQHIIGCGHSRIVCILCMGAVQDSLGRREYPRAFRGASTRVFTRVLQRGVKSRSRVQPRPPLRKHCRIVFCCTGMH